MATLKLSGKMRVIPFEAPETLKQVLMRRDRMSAEEADERIAEAREQVEDGEDPEEILHEEFGLEPDYVFDLLGY